MILCLIRIYFQPAASLVPTSHAPRPCRAWQPEKQGEEGDRKGGMRGGRGLWTLEDFPAQRGERCPLPWAAGSTLLVERRKQEFGKVKQDKIQEHIFTQLYRKR